MIISSVLYELLRANDLSINLDWQRGAAREMGGRILINRQKYFTGVERDVWNVQVAGGPRGLSADLG